MFQDGQPPPRRSQRLCYRLTLEYDGSRYAGWQEQREARTIAGELRRALCEALADPELDLGGAGRTDAGVHALGQVAHLRTTKTLDGETLRQRVNDLLPSDICVLDIEPAAPTFHARHDALARYYLYQIALRRMAFAKKYVWWVRDPLDVGRMRAAAEVLRGFHDFTAFSQKGPTDHSLTRDELARTESRLVDVHELTISLRPGLVVVRVGASHFLWRMVRRMVGALVAVGTGKLTVDDIQRLLNSRQPSEQISRLTAPASGLFLERVEYPREPVQREPVDIGTRLGLPAERDAQRRARKPEPNRLPRLPRKGHP
ncbi:tRNA pseudouridine(38-40) synthase TruA [Chloracidobacterium validum]|uniref:tRNA pseudouridine synthase A n=2 Tax=Chloracidobacterium validum TaxID=2821543 RepID=A0ABX8BDK7_9BACT|nr:tRNA pseudouridine(38-40) synthase TruA [Chloracidobacterium validum]